MHSSVYLCVCVCVCEPFGVANNISSKHFISFPLIQSYIALPKGGLVPQHVLILPIGHYAASTDAPQVHVNSSKHLNYWQVESEQY